MFYLSREFLGARRAIVTAAGAGARNGSTPECYVRSIGLWNPPPETLDTATREHRNSGRPRRGGTAGIAKPDARRMRLPGTRSTPQASTSCDLFLYQRGRPRRLDRQLPCRFADYFPKPRPTFAARQIDAAQQQRQLLLAQHHFALSGFRLRPAKAPLLQTLGANPQSAAIPEQQLQPIPLRVREDEDVPAQRLQLQLIAHQAVETLEAFTHVGAPRRQVDPRRQPYAKHAQPRSTTVSNRCSVSASKPQPISIRRPPGSATTKPLGLPRFASALPQTSTASQRFPSAPAPKRI